MVSNNKIVLPFIEHQNWSTIIGIGEDQKKNADIYKWGIAFKMLISVHILNGLQDYNL